jgi:hypothetical protein
VNENQFAACINLVIPISLWLAIDSKRRAAAEGRLSHPGVLFLSLAALQLTSVLLCGSRAGITIALAGVTTVGVLEFLRWKGEQFPFAALSAWPLLVGLALALVTGLWLAWGTLSREFSTIRNLSKELNYRGRMYASVWAPDPAPEPSPWHTRIINPKTCTAGFATRTVNRCRCSPKPDSPVVC